MEAEEEAGCPRGLPMTGGTENTQRSSKVEVNIRPSTSFLQHRVDMELEWTSDFVYFFML